MADRAELQIVTTRNADTPSVYGLAPLLVIDVWEHAYYLDHQERRADYVAGVVDHLLDWQFAEANFQRSTGRRVARKTAPADSMPAQPHA